MQTERPPLLRLWTFARHHRPRILWATVFSILNKLFDLAPPFLIGAAVDVVVERQNSLLARSIGISEPLNQLWLLAGISLFMWGMESLTEYIGQLLWRNLAQTVQHDLRIESYENVQGLDIAYFEDRTSGGLMAILNDDINQLERFLDVGANDILQLITTITAIGIFYFLAAPGVAWLAILPIPIIAWGSFRFQRRIAPRYAAVREQVGQLNSQLGNNLSGIATIKSFTSDIYRLKNREAIRLSSAFVPLIRIAIVLGFMATIVYGGSLVLSGTILVGVYSTMVFMTQRLLWPLTRLGQTFDLYQRAMASSRRALDLLDTKPVMQDGNRPLQHEQVAGEIRFEDVGFAYQDSSSVLDSLSLVFAAGKTTGIVGATGAGKSTVVKLLMRFYDPQQGRIVLDGLDLRELKVTDLRRAIGFVSQDVFLFHGTVRDNIAYGRPGVGEDEIRRAAQVAEAHEFILQLPDGYDTVVGERGQKLSGGQRQRISIARAVLKDPPILVLDEATSAVDNETESAIQRSLEKLALGRTTVIIAHRLSTIRNAEQIYVLDGGRLEEVGRHQALLEEDGIYAGLWRVQTGARQRVTG
jgi:ATP-binding cassette subfamily B protein